MTSQLRIPEHFTEIEGEEDHVMSNFDHTINEEIAAQLKESPIYAGYSGWNFHGKVWFQDGQYHCEVRTYGSYNETHSDESLEEIMTSVSSEYGYD